MESDKMESRMAHRSVEAFGSGLSLMNDSFIRPRQRSPLMFIRMATRCKKFNAANVSKMRDSSIPIACRSLPILVDFSSSVKKHVVADDEDLVESSDVLMATGSMKSIDSGVSLKSDQSKAELTNFKDRVSLRLVDFSSSEEEHDVTYVEDWSKLLNDQRAHRSVEAFGSGLSSMNDSFIRPRQRSPLILVDFDSDVSAVEDWNKLLDDLMATGSTESIHSGVSLKSDQSKDGLFDFKDRVSPSRLDFSSSEKKHVVSDDGFFESPDDLARHEPGAVV